MSIQIKFDSTYNAYPPTLVLATRSGRKLGKIPAEDIIFKNKINSYSELSFKVYKFDNGKEYHLWSQLKDFRLAYCCEWDIWFELKVELNESGEITKNVTAKSLGESELSQINLYDLEINTENDIALDDYVPTVLFDSENPKASLLHRITEKAPHYRIKHVDTSISNIQRTFSFNSTSIYNAFQEIAKEINCIFIIGSGSDDNGNIDRTISVFDLESFCLDCNKRTEFIDRCPHCGSKNFISGYGEDTTIFISSKNLAENINYSTDVDSVKNCFKLTAGDDLMTATIANCNPNGSGYIWYISDEMKDDMSEELVSRLDEYDELYAFYQSEYRANIDEDLLLQYNNIVDKYTAYSEDLEKIPNEIVGHSALMNAYYNTIDLYLFLNNKLMPSVSMQDTSALLEAEKLITDNLSPIVVSNLETCSLSTASSAIVSYAKTFIDMRYQVRVNESSLNGTMWTGNFIIKNYSDEEDYAISSTIAIEIIDKSANNEQYIKQSLDKVLNQSSDETTDISSLFNLDLSDFSNEIKKYCLVRLMAFHDACQVCLDLLIDQGVADKAVWTTDDSNLYEKIYLEYYNKLICLQEEIKTREEEIAVVVGKYQNDEMGFVGLQNAIESTRNQIQETLDFEKFLGEDLWLEFSSYRREDTYENSNYISDGLNNAELFEKAFEFIDVAKKDIIKSATLQHSIDSTLKNLLVLKEFSPIVEYFDIGNWIRVKVDDSIYRLRLVEYEINFKSLNNINIVFSDVTTVANDGISDLESIVNRTTSMMTSYNSVKRQAKRGEKGNKVVDGWIENGLSATNTKIVGGASNQVQVWDKHGMLFRKYDFITDSYDDIQLKIINSTISITDDNWKSVKTAIGEYYYINPETSKMEKGYGINAELLVGNLIIGKQLFIHNEDKTLLFNTEGFTVKNEINTVNINPSKTSIFSIKKDSEDIFSFDDEGNLIIKGKITATSLVLVDTKLELTSDNVSGLSEVAITGKYEDLIDAPQYSKVATSGKYEDLLDTPTYSSVAETGDYNDLINKPTIPDVSNKFDNPSNESTSTEGQYLSKDANGSVWKDVATSIISSGNSPVSGKAVYDFALNKRQSPNDVDKILTIDYTGEIIFMTIEELKTKLEIQGGV